MSGYAVEIGHLASERDRIVSSVLPAVRHLQNARREISAVDGASALVSGALDNLAVELSRAAMALEHRAGHMAIALATARQEYLDTDISVADAFRGVVS